MWFLRGKKPVAKFFWSNKKINVFGALMQNGKLFCEQFDAQNSLTYKAFLSDFIDSIDMNKKYIFILDNASYHKTNVIKNYLAKFNNIKVEFLPPYSPELNPIESCWKKTRYDITNSNFFPNLEKMLRKLEQYWKRNKFKLNFTNYLCP